MRKDEPTLSWDFYGTRWGRGLVAARDGAVSQVMLPAAPEEALLARLRAGVPDACLAQGSSLTLEAARILERYFAGDNVRFSLPLCWEGITEFRRRVMEAAAQIPWGQQRTYGWLAEAACNPRAARACGQVMARNPFPVVIPCHRVVAAGGSLGGFSSGLEWKKRLLTIESGTPAE